MKEKYKLKIRLFRIGLDACWPKFNGLKERPDGYPEELKDWLNRFDICHRKVGKELSVEMSVKNGKIPLLSVVQETEGKLVLLTLEGESMPGSILKIGNTNSRNRFTAGVKNFVKTWNSYGPANHCAAETGHVASGIKKLGELLDMEVIQVC